MIAPDFVNLSDFSHTYRSIDIVTLLIYSLDRHHWSVSDLGMLNVARRGPALIAKSFLSPSRSSRCIKSIIIRTSLHAPTRILPTRSIRAISTTAQWTQRALASPEEEEYENEEQGDTQQPPSGSQIDEGTQYGPVTKFEDLGTRNMVCKTVVNTITKRMGLETMTQVQSLTINETLKGIDV